MAKKKSERRSPKPAVRIEGVLESVTDELARVIGVLSAVPEMSPGDPDEIAEWARVLKVKLRDRGDSAPFAPASAAAIAAWRLDRVWTVLDALRAHAALRS